MSHHPVQRRWHARFALALTLVLVLTTLGISGGTAAPGTPTQYVVVYADGVSVATARAAISVLGGTIVQENAAIGVATITTTNADFMSDVLGQPALAGAARDTPVGYAPKGDVARTEDSDVERMPLQRESTPESRSNAPDAAASSGEPLSNLQWDMRMIDATLSGSYKKQRGDRGVLVGVIDTGVDGTHPDIAPNFDSRLSRNFTTDIPEIDGPCEVASCKDPANVDDNGHGTHVAGTIGAAINGLGIAGVAPNVTLVNLRAGQDSGYFFLQPTLDALTYAGDRGIDVVNMSYFIDPWRFNCANNPADSPEAQLEQRTVITATQRALNYAHKKGVTLIAALGNEHTDMGNPTFDNSSPNYPPGTTYDRTIDNTCLTLPTEGEFVISVVALGPSGRKAYYSNYGAERADISAPGGDRYDGPDDQTNRILSTYPESVLRAGGYLNPDGTPNTPSVVRDCRNGVCAYYAYLQGTSMASPHVAGVAALIVSQYGSKAKGSGGKTLNPGIVGMILLDKAVNHACPDPRLLDYPDPVPPDYDATCEGLPYRNGFYGDGIVDALRAVSIRR